MAEAIFTSQDFNAKQIQREIDDLNKSLKALNSTISNELTKSLTELKKDSDSLTKSLQSQDVATEEGQKGF